MKWVALALTSIVSAIIGAILWAVFMIMTENARRGALLALALLALTACGAPAYDPVDTARDGAEIARYEAEAERTLALADDWTQATRVTLWACVGFAIALAAWAMASLALDARRRTLELRALSRAIDAGVLPTLDGRLPVPVELLPVASMAALGGLHGARQLSVADQVLPDTLTFSARVVPADPQLRALLEAPPVE